jgi:tripartite-type tricarboxylate transporter receptor subunit TctC
VLCVPANSPFNSLQDIIDAAKKRPNQLVYGSGGNGSPSHLIAELIRQKLGLEIMHVPYRGPSEALSGLLSGDSQLMFVTTSVAAAQIKGGKLKALAVTSEKRVNALPEVPTLAELGIKAWN